MVKVINHPYTVRIEGRWRRSRAQRSVSPILTSEFDNVGIHYTGVGKWMGEKNTKTFL